LTDRENDNLTNKNVTYFPSNSVAGCIFNVEYSVGGNLELRDFIIKTLLSLGVYADNKNFPKNSSFFHNFI
jgi:hypothetical protein